MFFTARPILIMPPTTSAATDEIVRNMTIACCTPAGNDVNQFITAPSPLARLFSIGMSTAPIEMAASCSEPFSCSIVPLNVSVRCFACSAADFWFAVSFARFAIPDAPSLANTAAARIASLPNIVSSVASFCWSVIPRVASSSTPEISAMLLTRPSAS